MIRASAPTTTTTAPQGDDEEIAKLTERMKSLLGPFVLRRLKQEVAGQLTSKTHATGALGGAAEYCSGVLCSGWLVAAAAALPRPAASVPRSGR